MRRLPPAVAIALVVCLAIGGYAGSRILSPDTPQTDPGRGEPSPAGAAADHDYTSPILPIVLIEVGGRPIEKSSKTEGVLRVVEQHAGQLDDLETAPVSFESPVAVEIQGSTTVTLPKLSYDIELRDRSGEDDPERLLGLPRGADWVLKGCGRDKTCLRDAFVYATVRDLGRYAPRTRFVELFMDGEYGGLYILTEKIRRDDNRVALPAVADDPAEGDITGSYLFKMELGEGSPGDQTLRDWVSPVSPMVYSYVYPRFDRITDAQKAYLQEYVASFETMMQGPDWDHPSRGYRGWIDVPSWVDYALIHELANNTDSYFKSVYLQKWPASLGNRLALGPVWDFDTAFGMTQHRDGRRTDVWAHTMNRFGTLPVPYDPPGAVPHVPDYWERLWTDVAFQTDLQCRWQVLRAGPLRLDRLTTRIDAWVTQLALARPREEARWPTESFPGQIASLTDWLARRVAWMDENLPGTCP